MGTEATEMKLYHALFLACAVFMAAEAMDLSTLETKADSQDSTPDMPTSDEASSFVSLGEAQSLGKDSVIVKNDKGDSVVVPLKASKKKGAAPGKMSGRLVLDDAAEWEAGKKVKFASKMGLKDVKGKVSKDKDGKSSLAISAIEKPGKTKKKDFGLTLAAAAGVRVGSTDSSKCYSNGDGCSGGANEYAFTKNTDYSVTCQGSSALVACTCSTGCSYGSGSEYLCSGATPSTKWRGGSSCGITMYIKSPSSGGSWASYGYVGS